MIKRIIIFFCLALFLNACATPTVINVIGPNDNKLNCKELSLEIAKANKYADEAQEARKMSKPHNIGALLFFLPGAAFTISNADDAVKAAKDRAIHLNKLKENKNC